MLSGNNSSRARDFPSTGEESFLPVVSILSKKLISSEIFSFLLSQILRKHYSQMSAIFFIFKSEIFSFVSSQILRKRYSQMLAVFLSRVKCYANVILKCGNFLS